MWVSVSATSLAIFCVSCSMMCGGATAQTAAGGSISVNADEVLVDLLVHDGNGRTVLDLKPQQLAVMDDGSEVQLEMEVAKDGRVVGKIPLPVRSDAGEGTVIPYLASIQTRCFRLAIMRLPQW
jgi:hypothetical protein